MQRKKNPKSARRRNKRSLPNIAESVPFHSDKQRKNISIYKFGFVIVDVLLKIILFKDDQNSTNNLLKSYFRSSKYCVGMFLSFYVL